ncbi:hypothetical protein C8Q80DRAFT_1269824 [Daedaleopsis nitida]|nr:hypothetical protein C8Q80DRAFT_1269824 [Daedaleopsis nitida]
MSGIHTTPFARKATNQPIAVEDTLKARAQEGWRRELQHRVHISKDDDKDFLRKYVPSNTPYLFVSDLEGLADLFADWRPVAGKEKESYPYLTKGLNALVSTFPPAKRPAFFDCHDHQQSFPFSAFADNHSITYPDLAGTLPGLPLPDLPSKPEWSHFSIILEGKAKRQDDPFSKEGLEHCNTLVQLAINARCLMHAHGLLAAFVFGVYGDIVRIARFDHSCAVVSRRLSLKKATHLKVIQQFFWNFVNPCDGQSIVGCDPTVRQLTNNDKQWLYHRLVRVGVNPKEVVAEEARWAQVFDDDSSEPKSYVMFKALDVNGRLFSRSTTVWLALRDTRLWIDGDLIDDPQPEDLKLRIIKEAWRQLVRRPEDEYYARLDVIPQKDKVGLSSLLYGGDLGEREVRQWEHALYGTSTPRNELDFAAHPSRLTTATSATHAPVPPSLTSTTSADQPPSHRPMQQTFTWRLVRGPEYWHRERSHMRFVVDIVGRPLTAFRSTKELVTAIYHAVKGHRLAMTRAGVLHRDVSVGNILIVDNPDDQAAFSGFLHDFDYSSMSRDVPDADCDSLGAAALAEKLVADADAGVLKERTGTFYFMATNLLLDGTSLHCIGHDLEAFFWVLVWVLVRHVEHSGGTALCAKIFSNESNGSALGNKMIWLANGVHSFSIPGNAPLNKLIKELAALLSANVFNHSAPDYDAFLAPFEEALKRTDWPEGDKSNSDKMPELRTHHIGWEVPPKVAGSKRKTQEYDPEEEFSDRGDNDDDMAVASDAEEMQVEYLLFSKPPDDDPSTLDVAPAPAVGAFRQKDAAVSRSKRRKTGSRRPTGTQSSANTGSSATGATSSYRSDAPSSMSMAPSIASSRTSFEDTGSAASQGDLNSSSGTNASKVAPKTPASGSQGIRAPQAGLPRKGREGGDDRTPQSRASSRKDHTRRMQS